MNLEEALKTKEETETIVKSLQVALCGAEGCTFFQATLALGKVIAQLAAIQQRRVVALGQNTYDGNQTLELAKEAIEACVNDIKTSNLWPEAKIPEGETIQ